MADVQEMSGIATLLNPLISKDSAPELLTFWNNSLGDLVLAQRSDLSKPKPILFSKAVKQTGIVKNPSSLVSLLYNGMVHVYGVVPVGTEADKTSTIKRLSPTVQPLDYEIVLKTPASLAGITSPENTDGWLYFLSQDKDEKTVISEYALGSTDPPVQINVNPVENSYLAATYLPSTDDSAGERRVFFQRGGKIHMVNADTQEVDPLADTDIARAVTPLAACNAKDSQGKDTIYLYFVDGVNNINRAVIKPGSVTVNRVDKVNKMFSWSQLAVSLGKTENYISYVQEVGGKRSIAVISDKRT